MRGGLLRRDRGAAAVEFALLMPLLFMILFGIIQFGYLFFQKQQAAFAAREGARIAAVGTMSCPDLVSAVRSRVNSRAPGDVSVAVTYGPAPVTTDSTLTITVSFPVTDFGLPFIPFITGSTIVEDAEARVENVTANTADCSS